MEPRRRIDSLSAGELIRQLSARRTTRERFNIPLAAEELYRALSAAYAAEVRSRGYEPDFDEATCGAIMDAARWLADGGGKCGLMLQGLYGNGKTTLMMAMCNLINYLYHSNNSNERVSIRVADAREIARLGVRDETRARYEKLAEAELLAIDDLGEEPSEILVYGMTYTPVRDLLLERYKRQKFTIVATNLINTREKPQLAEHYGERVVDRIREMMKIIVFRNDSYRNRLRPRAYENG